MKIVLAVNDFRDAYGLINVVLNKDRSAMLRLKKELGPCFRVIMGNLDGYDVVFNSFNVARLQTVFYVLILI